MVNCSSREIVLNSECVNSLEEVATNGYIDSQEIEGLLDRISTYDHEKIHQRLSRKRLAGTAHWFLNHPDFKAWLTEKKFPSLWCSGKSEPAS